MKHDEATVTLPIGLARVLMQAAHWRCVPADLEPILGASLLTDEVLERRYDVLDQWFAQVDKRSGARGSDAMLRACLASWKRGERP